ncbi:MAG: TonB-dependent receptor, partial [Candidatus Marinimicrobia bacterium]|nr:TonB-dependent receptor [Candidatus Neomarinimicrobiota bacterium]
MSISYHPMRFILTALLVLVFAIDKDLSAQPRGGLSGNVVDKESGDPMPGVNVVLPGTYHGAATDLNGKYVIVGVSAGEYTVRFQFIGYTTLEVTGVKITPGLTATLNAELNQTVLAAGQEIVVIGKPPLFDVEETASRRVISAREIANSVVENVEDIVGNQVGVVKVDGEIHIRGGRSYENAYLLDGVSVQDPLSGTGFGLQLSSNAIEEVEVITGGLNAEYGQAMSGIVNVKMKEGTNLYHGSLSYKTDNFGIYGKESEFNFNTDVVELSMDGPDPLFGVLFPKLGFDLKGTQTFFANTYMFISDDFTKYSADTLISSIFHGTKFAPRGNNNWSAMLKYTWGITPKHKLQFSYNASASINQNTRSLQTNLELVPPGPGYPFRFQKNLENFNTFTHLNRLTSLNWTHTLGSRTFYELKFSNFYTNLRRDVDGKYWNEFTEPQDMLT